MFRNNNFLQIERNCDNSECGRFLHQPHRSLWSALEANSPFPRIEYFRKIKNISTLELWVVSYLIIKQLPALRPSFQVTLYSCRIAALADVESLCWKFLSNNIPSDVKSLCFRPVGFSLPPQKFPFIFAAGSTITRKFLRFQQTKISFNILSILNYQVHVSHMWHKII